MTRTVKLQTTIGEDRTLHIRVPDDVPIGPAEIDVTITPESEQRAGTAADLAQSPLVGLWAGRDDIEDSVAYARELRRRAGRRSHG